MTKFSDVGTGDGEAPVPAQRGAVTREDVRASGYGTPTDVIEVRAGPPYHLETFIGTQALRPSAPTAKETV